MIDITITATRRPEILDRTLKSFTENLFFQKYDPLSQDDIQVYINVDPTGLMIPSEATVRICMNYFDNVKFRIADKAHFPTAFLWCWKQTSSKFVFHLEEDWELLRPISFHDMYVTMVNNPNLAHLRLSSWRSEETLKNWNKFLFYNGHYFEVPEDIKGTIGFCGHPSLNRIEFVKACIDHLDPNRNPEKQIKWRNKPLWNEIGKYQFGSFQKPYEPAAIKDIGRRWMINHGFSKKGNKAEFVEWEKVQQE